MGYTVAELLQRISAHELREWMAFESIEPFGKETQYYGPAMTTAMLANVNRKKGTKPITADVFVPKFEPPEPQSTGQMLNFAQNLTVALGGQDLSTTENE